MKTYLSILSLILFISCQTQNQTKKKVVEEKKPLIEQKMSAKEEFADVFGPWNGKWKGQFIVYNDPNGQQKGKAQPREISKAMLDGMGLEESLRIDVEQEYVSTSPYYQTVKIRDTYTDGDGKVNVVESTGYNKVEDTQILCVVNKPDEQVIHQGMVPADSTIIWGRDVRDPTKVEYFYEEIKANTYFIVGWGYYGEDDPELTPKTWFYAAYQRVE